MKEHNEENAPLEEKVTFPYLRQMDRNSMTVMLPFLTLKDQVTLFSTSNAQSKEMRDHISISKLLYLVVRGKQDEAEAMIRDNPELLIKSGDITDGAGRCFKNITALQYAVWALDAHMWTMMLPYFISYGKYDQAANQVGILEEKGTEHGYHFDFGPLLNAYEVYFANYDAWSWKQQEKHWFQEVGGAQSNSPEHVLQQYTTPDRPLSPCPDFSIAAGRVSVDVRAHNELTRFVFGHRSTAGRLNIIDRPNEYANSDPGVYGLERHDRTAICRGPVTPQGGLSVVCNHLKADMSMDAAAMQNLAATRRQELNQLLSELDIRPDSKRSAPSSP